MDTHPRNDRLAALGSVVCRPSAMVGELPAATVVELLLAAPAAGLQTKMSVGDERRGACRAVMMRSDVEEGVAACGKQHCVEGASEALEGSSEALKQSNRNLRARLLDVVGELHAARARIAELERFLGDDTCHVCHRMMPGAKVRICSCAW